MKKTFFLSLSIFLFFGYSQSQEVWTIEKCVQHALENNLQLKQNGLNVERSESYLVESKGSFLPNLGASVGHRFNFGRSIDQATNQFVNNTTQNSSVSLNSNMPVFNGFAISNTIKQNKLNLEADQYSYEQTKNNITLSVLTAYLQILLYEESLKINQQQAALTQKQVERIKIMLEAGVAVKSELLDIEAQLANEELNIVTAQNNLDLAYLDLKQLLNLDINKPFQVENPSIEIIPVQNADSTDMDLLLRNAKQNNPGLKSSQLRLLSRDKGLAIAQSGRMPSISLGWSLSAYYSSLGKELVGYNPDVTIPIGYLASNPSETVLSDYPGNPILADQPLFDQLNNNLGQNVSIGVSIPIFNRFQTQQSINRAKINYLDAKYANEIANNNLTKEVQQAITNLKAAQKKYLATEKSKEAAEKSFEFAELRYNQKVITSLDYVNAKNKTAMAASNLLQAKYDYIFKSKILDFYQGNEIKL